MLYIVWSLVRRRATFLNIAKYSKTGRCGCGSVAIIFSMYLCSVLYIRRLSFRASKGIMYPGCKTEMFVFFRHISATPVTCVRYDSFYTFRRHSLVKTISSISPTKQIFTHLDLRLFYLLDSEALSLKDSHTLNVRYSTGHY